MRNKINTTGFTIGELIVASAIAILVVGGAFALWFMTQDAWVNERTKSAMLQDIQNAIERIKREMQMSDGGKIFFHTAADGTYDAISLPLALDDGRSDTGYSAAQDGDGFIETNSTTYDPITQTAKIFWDQTVIYHVYHNATTDKYELRRTVFYPRNNSLTTAQRQDQINKVVSLGTGNDATVPESATWQSTRPIFKSNSILLEAAPQYREFDGYSATTERTENLIDFGSIVLASGYHTLKFKATRKNIVSTSYGMGIDLLQFTPSGGLQEGEIYAGLTHPDGSSGIAGSSGDAMTTVKMHNSPYGVWSNDYYLNYAANAVNDYLTLRFYYDIWNETTFLDGVSNNVVVEFSNTDGRGGTSGDEEYLVRLEGNDKTWGASSQTQDVSPGSLVLPVGSSMTYRNILLSNYCAWNGMMVSVKFKAGTSDPLIIKSAYITQTEDSGSDPSDNGSINMPSIPITFANCNLDPRNAGQPTLPAPTGNGVIIHAGGYAWSNWVQLVDNDSAAFNFDKTQNYFVTFYINTTDDGQQSISEWEDTATTPKTHCYTRSGDWDDVATWGGTGTAESSIYGVEEAKVTYTNSGTFTSKIFDTGVTNPDYGTMNWSFTNNAPDATLQMRVRTDASGADLESDSNWSAIPGTVFTASPAALASLANERYVQFRAEFTALASDGTASHITDDTDDTYLGDEDYDLTCVLKDVSIYWPGNTTMVDIAGYFTKKSDYGIFTVEVDGQPLTKGFEVKLSIEEDLTTGSTVTRSISTEVEPRNTNK